MIEIHSLDGTAFHMNNDLFIKIEACPDTIITLLDGRTLRVKETPEEIIARIVAFKRRIFQGHWEVST